MATKLSENLQRIRDTNREHQRMYVKDWRDNLPEGSLWYPGSTGKPACQICHGLGWVRRDLPFGHPGFGKLSQCDCSR